MILMILTVLTQDGTAAATTTTSSAVKLEAVIDPTTFVEFTVFLLAHAAMLHAVVLFDVAIIVNMKRPR